MDPTYVTFQGSIWSIHIKYVLGIYGYVTEIGAA